MTPFGLLRAAEMARKMQASMFEVQGAPRYAVLHAQACVAMQAILEVPGGGGRELLLDSIEAIIEAVANPDVEATPERIARGTGLMAVFEAAVERQQREGKADA